MPIGLSFPFKEIPLGGVFDSTATSQEAVKANLLHLLTTKRGQRVMRSEFYSPLFDYIHEPFDEITSNRMKEDLEDKILDFVPEITLKDIDLVFYEAENRLEVKLVYEISELGRALDELELNIIRD